MSGWLTAILSQCWGCTAHQSAPPSDGAAAVAGRPGDAGGNESWWGGWAWLSLFVMVLALAPFWIYRSVLAQGLRPFPTAPHTDLPSVLKALLSIAPVHPLHGAAAGSRAG